MKVGDIVRQIPCEDGDVCYTTIESKYGVIAEIYPSGSISAIFDGEDWTFYSYELEVIEIE